MENDIKNASKNTCKYSGTRFSSAKRLGDTPPKDSHIWQHVAERLHKHASIGSNKHKKNIKILATREQNVPTQIARKMTKITYFLIYFYVLLVYFVCHFQSIFCVLLLCAVALLGQRPPYLPAYYEQHKTCHETSAIFNICL